MSSTLTDDEQNLLTALHVDTNDEKSFYEWAEFYDQSCKEFLQYALSHKKLKVSTRQIPAKVRLPKVLRNNIILRDIQVCGKRREPDDAIYAGNAKIRSLVARGNTLLTYKSKDKDITCFPLYGMKKFTGGMGDDDDQTNGGDNYTWQKFFTQPSENASHIILVISTSKENGSAAHLSALYIDNEYVLIGGSKNSHLLLSLEHGEEDLKLYPSSPWIIAKIIMKSIFDLFNEIGKENTLKFVSLLAKYHLTAVFEMLDPNDQHVELLTNPNPIVRFITFTTGWQGDKPVQNQLCMYPLHTVKVIKSYNIPTIQYDIIQLSGSSDERITIFETLQKQIRSDFGNEGKVLYFSTKENEVIGLLKKKTLWYIILRALREKFKLYLGYLSRVKSGKPNKFNSLEEQKKGIDELIIKRLNAIQQWLGYSDKCKDEWIQIGLQANNWVYNQLESAKLNPDLLGNQFPVVWDLFLKDTKSSDKIVDSK